MLTQQNLPVCRPSALRRGFLLLILCTLVRAAFGGEGGSASFPEAVLRQDGQGFPATWGTNGGKPVIADYAMDPEVVTNAAYRGEMAQALAALPSLRLSVDRVDLFSSSNGIYANPRESGDAWERRCLIEFDPTNGHPGFRGDAGVRIQGGWNRRPEESPKHSFRLVFRKQYGAGKLKYRLFDDGVKEFDQLILRSGNNHSWLHWSAVERRSADYLRDQWMRETYSAMGQLSARGRFVHLYLNGLYWGIYNLTERPDEHFAAAHLGGRAADYDARNAGKILSGDDVAWQRLFALANAGPTNQEQFAVISELLDVPAFCDYMLLNLYGANADWDAESNWYAARKRAAGGRFIFFVWDGERTLERAGDNQLHINHDFSPTRLFQKLRACPEFRAKFAERARVHLTADGVLTSLRAGERFQRLAESLDTAIVAESARWGDYRRDVHQYKEGPYELYTRDLHWRPEVKRLQNDYFPRRTGLFIAQLQAAQLYR